MAGCERDGMCQTLEGKDRPTHQLQSEGSATEVRRQRLLPVGAAADYLGVSRATVERLVYRGELPTVKVAGSGHVQTRGVTTTTTPICCCCSN